MKTITDRQREDVFNSIPPILRGLFSEADLAELTSDEIAHLMKVNITPEVLCGPNLLHVHNMLRETQGLRDLPTTPLGHM